jgi:hypothetical protein
MRRTIKLNSSTVVVERLSYKDGHNNELRQLLADEQHNICAYTETHLGPSDDAHIDHFNPLLKGTTEDSYQNWFLIKGLWNTKKARKWIDYQPILHPTAPDLEQRIVYIDGDYAAADPNDIEATNLIRLLGLDNARLADQRKRYITRTKRDIADSPKSGQQYIDDFLRDYPEGVYFIRALEAELAVTVNFSLLNRP